MKIRVSLLALLSLFLFGCSQEHTPDRQSEVVIDQHFISADQALEFAQSIPTDGEWKLLGTDQELGTARSASATTYQPAYYLFGGEKAGFLVLSASEVAYPILGYSDSEHLDANHLPCGFRYMLEKYAYEINAARKAGLSPSEGMRALRSSTRAADPGADIVVEPLLGDIKWDQTPYYNDYAPGESPIGCVATATAQILRYHEYPSSSVGQYGYYSPFGYLHHDFNYTLDWSQMPKAKLDKSNEMVARFMYGVAIAVQMNFGRDGSGTTHDKVPPALIRFYKYPKNVIRLVRANMETPEWTNTIKNELDHKRPVLHGGIGSGGGHSFVCDGYATNDMFHFNWGWGGMADGWFKLDALNPEDLGTGAGMGEYNRNQDIVVHIAPPARILGDDSSPVADDNDQFDDETEALVEHAVNYDAVYVLKTNEFFVSRTKFNNKEFFSGADGFILFGKKSEVISAVAGEPLQVEIDVDRLNRSMIPVVSLFIDYNDNGVLYYKKPKDGTATRDKGEMIKSMKMDEDTTRFSYTIPADAQKGLHRLRLLLNEDSKRGNKPTIALPHAPLQLVGEVEDYYIEIK